MNTIRAIPKTGVIKLIYQFSINIPGSPRATEIGGCDAGADHQNTAEPWIQVLHHFVSATFSYHFHYTILGTLQ